MYSKPSNTHPERNQELWMKLVNRPPLTALILTSLALLVGCNYPGFKPSTPVGPEIVLTYAAQTIEAQIQQATSQATMTPYLPQPTTPAPATPPPTLPAGITPSPPAASATPGLCDQAGFVADVTIPDNTRLDPGQTFTKTWRLKNTGTCTWDTNYAIVFVRGEALGAPVSVPLPSAVAPGQEVEISVNMTAPVAVGTYQGYWRLRNAAGTVFGLGVKADKDFWVKIQVGVVSGLAYDFLVMAPEARWSGSGGGADEVGLAFNGPPDHADGFAGLVQNVTLENGKSAGVTLVMHPRHANDGMVTGLFPEYVVQSGDHFIANLGFLQDCEPAQVIFRFAVQIGDRVDYLGDWRETCDGSLNNVNLDLSGLAGKRVKFLFAVLADGSPEGDLALWGSARIER
jgi:hypothetical protein